MNDPLNPQNRFQQAPNHFSRPVAQAARVVEVLPRSLLTIRRFHRSTGPEDMATLSKDLLSAIPRLKAGGPVDIEAPVRRGGKWYLDTRTTATRRLPERGVARFTIAQLKAEHWLRPAGARPGTFGGAQGTAGVHESLVFTLGAEVLETVCGQDPQGNHVCISRGTGYFELLPVR